MYPADLYDKSVNSGISKAKVNDLEGAISEFSYAIDFCPGQPVAWRFRFGARWQLARQRLEHAHQNQNYEVEQFAHIAKMAKEALEDLDTAVRLVRQGADCDIMPDTTVLNEERESVTYLIAGCQKVIEQMEMDAHPVASPAVVADDASASTSVKPEPAYHYVLPGLHVEAHYIDRTATDIGKVVSVAHGGGPWPQNMRTAQIAFQVGVTQIVPLHYILRVEALKPGYCVKAHYTDSTSNKSRFPEFGEVVSVARGGGPWPQSMRTVQIVFQVGVTQIVPFDYIIFVGRTDASTCPPARSRVRPPVDLPARPRVRPPVDPPTNANAERAARAQAIQHHAAVATEKGTPQDNSDYTMPLPPAPPALASTQPTPLKKSDPHGTTATVTPTASTSAEVDDAAVGEHPPPPSGNTPTTVTSAASSTWDWCAMNGTIAGAMVGATVAGIALAATRHKANSAQLPPGWTEQLDHDGTPFYLNKATQQWTYNRPAPQQQLSDQGPSTTTVIGTLALGAMGGAIAGYLCSRWATRFADGLRSPRTERCNLFPTNWRPQRNIYDAMKQFGCLWDEARFDKMLQIVRKQRRNVLKEEHALAILAYTWEDGPSSLYILLNKAIRDRDTDKLDRWLDYIYHLEAALKSLPPFFGQVYRSLDCRVNEQEYEVGKQIRWHQFSSSSKEPGQSIKFLNPNCGGSFFIIKSATGKELVISWDPREKEVLLTYKSQFYVEERITNDGQKMKRWPELGQLAAKTDVYVLKEVVDHSGTIDKC